MALGQLAREPQSLSATLTRLRRAVVNWYTVGLLAALVMPTRVPPRKGLKGRWLGRRVATFRLYDGARIRCRLEDAGDVISVYVDRDYGRMPISWPSVRSIVDVGSTVGAFTIWSALQSPNARIVAVEPNPIVYPFLLDNARRNQLTNRVVVVEAALGAASGEGEIEDASQLSTLVRVVPIGNGTGPVVKMLTLEQLFAEMNLEHCDLLKIDCEGGEYEILLSTESRVLERVSTIVCEYHPVKDHDPKQIIDRLSACGFKVESDNSPIGFILAMRDA